MSHYRMFTKNQIKEIAKKASEDKVNLIETDDILSVLDDVKTGDIVHDNSMDTVCIVCFVGSEEPYSVCMFVADGGNDVIRYTSYIKDSHEDWVQDLDITYATLDDLNRQKGTKLYHHELAINGSGLSFSSPFQVITTTPSVFNKDTNFNLKVGVNCLSITDEDGALVSRITNDAEQQLEVTILLFDGSVYTESHDDITSIGDVVAPL